MNRLPRQRKEVAHSGYCTIAETRQISRTMELSYPHADPGFLVRAGAWPSREEADERALVLLAVGIECSVHPEHGGHVLLTAADELGKARHEIGLYEKEKEEAHHTTVIRWPEHSLGIAWMLAWATVLSQVYFLQLRDPGFTDAFANSSIALVERHEWWRPFTALFLHADPMHLLGNVLIGGLFCVLVARSLGAACGWLLILLGGTLGNAINAALHYPEPFRSIGASTATFAALGILVGLTAVESLRARSGRAFRTLAVPVLAGLILFSWFGISGELTDIGGHAWGSLCGLALGAIAGALQPAEATS